LQSRTGGEKKIGSLTRRRVKGVGATLLLREAGRELLAEIGRTGGRSGKKQKKGDGRKIEKRETTPRRTLRFEKEMTRGYVRLVGEKGGTS